MQNQAPSPAVLSREVARRARARVRPAPERRPASGITLGKLIAVERERQGFTRHELARAVDGTDKMIQYLETDRRNYWVKLREIIEFLAPRAGKLWMTQCTKMLMGKIDALVWEEKDPIRRLMLAEWLRSSGDRAVATSTGPQQSYLPGFHFQLKEPQLARDRVA